MKLVFQLIILVVFLLPVHQSPAQDVRFISLPELKGILDQKSDSVKVINFWASWCKPCVDEIPYFMQLKNDWKNRKVEWIFVSVDFVREHNDVLEKVTELKLDGELYQVNEKGDNWIDQVDTKWSGAIPYTLLIEPDGERSAQYFSFASYSDLKKFIEKKIPN